jgi:SAM-dependent methyltransferase
MSQDRFNHIDIVKRGYNKIASLYQAEREKFINPAELDAFVSSLPDTARVLDAGCGTGVPVARFLVDKGFRVVGIDLSETMISLARKNVPDAIYMEMNMLNMGFASESFDGIISCYAIIHNKRESNLDLFKDFNRILVPGGTMLVSVGIDDWEDIDNYYGVDMFWSHYAPDRTVALIKKAGFEIVFERAVESNDERHYWVMARKL